MLRRSLVNPAAAGAGGIGPMSGPRPNPNYHLPSGPYGRLKRQYFESRQTQGYMKGGVPRIYYGWMKPGSMTRRRFEKMRNPFVDFDNGTSIYYRDMKDPVEAIRAAEASPDNIGVKGMDNAIDLYNEHRIVPDIYAEGFQWKHKLNTEYNQWRSNTWLTPELIPAEHRGRLLCNFYVNVGAYEMEVAKFSPRDQRQWVYCCLYVGSGKGIAGWGQAIAPTTNDAKKEAIKNAFGNLIGVDLENDGPIYPMRMNVDGARVILYPSRKIVAALRTADILCAFGISKAGLRINVKATNKPHGTPRAYQAIFTIIAEMKSATEIAHARGKVPHSLVSNMFPYLEELRRRKGMFATSPAKKDGVFPSDRVVDNRLPDHLKKGYYDDKYWRDFFAGSKEHLSEPKLGLRSDQLRDLVSPKDLSVEPSTSHLTALLPEARSNNSGRGGDRNNNNQKQKQQQQQGSGRKTLADVLQRMGRNVHSLGHIRVTNPAEDKKLADHIRSHFHLH
jgi:ribosomal protein S5